jgi:hypothetical protein
MTEANQQAASRHPVIRSHFPVSSSAVLVIIGFQNPTGERHPQIVMATYGLAGKALQVLKLRSFFWTGMILQPSWIYK